MTNPDEQSNIGTGLVELLIVIGLFAMMFLLFWLGDAMLS